MITGLKKGAVLRPYALSVFLALSVAVFSGCSTETVFQSNFDPTPVNQPPAHNQDVGTANTDGPAGTVIVVASPEGASGKWVQVTRSNGQQSVSGFQGNCSKFIGDGEYTFSAVMFIPQGSGLVTIQFESFGQPVNTLTSFLHLDFTEDNKIRLDDNDATKFGSFTRNQSFIIQVSLNINATASTAHIVLSGAGASGVSDYTVLPPFRGLARQFGAVRLWMGFPWTGAFDATNIVVTHKTN